MIARLTKRLREFVKMEPEGVVLAAVLVAGLVAIGLWGDEEAFGCSVSIDSQPSDTTTTGGYLPSIEESPVWFLEDDGTWTCVPGGDDPSVCDGAEPPEPVGGRR